MSFHRENIIKLKNTECEYKLIISIEKEDDNFIKFQLENMQAQMNEIYYLEMDLEKLKLLNSYFRIFDSINDCATNLSNIIKDCSPKLSKENEKMVLSIKIYLAGQDAREINLIFDKKNIESNEISKELKEEINKLKAKVNDLEMLINKKDIIINEIKTNYENLKKSCDSFVEKYNIDLMNLRSLLPQQNNNFYNINPNQNPNLMSYDELRMRYNNEESLIIDNNNEKILLLSKFGELYPGKKVFYNLLYRKSRDSDKSLIFHEKCDKINGTLIVIKTETGLKFGGYTNETWEGNNICKFDKSAFIFSLNNNKIYDIKPNSNAIYCSPQAGPCFCGKNVATLLVCNNSDINGGMCSIAENSNYNGYNYDYEINNGQNQFRITEYEVFKVTIV